tara:strand:- start:82 stop:939 length:858 start_codon:yes stop_codon:yes gene_type:complete
MAKALKHPIQENSRKALDLLLQEASDFPYALKKRGVSEFGEREKAILDSLILEAFDVYGEPYIKLHPKGTEGFRGNVDRAYYGSYPEAKSDTIGVFDDKIYYGIIEELIGHGPQYKPPGVYGDNLVALKDSLVSARKQQEKDFGDYYGYKDGTLGMYGYEEMREFGDTPDEGVSMGRTFTYPVKDGKNIHEHYHPGPESYLGEHKDEPPLPMESQAHGVYTPEWWDYAANIMLQDKNRDTGYFDPEQKMLSIKGAGLKPDWYHRDMYKKRMIDALVPEAIKNLIK